MKLGIVGAMEEEIAYLREQLENVEEFNFGGIDFYQGTLGGNSVVLASSGIGKVYAAVATQIFIDRFDVTGVINIGLAGGAGEGLRPGDFVVVLKSVQYDYSLEPLGDPWGKIPGMPLYIPSDPDLVAFLESTLQELGYNFKTGIAVTADSFLADSALKDLLVKTFDASCVDMESAAIAQVCYANRVDFTALRIISDSADESAEEDYSSSKEFLGEQLNRIFHGVLKEEF